MIVLPKHIVERIQSVSKPIPVTQPAVSRAVRMSGALQSLAKSLRLVRYFKSFMCFELPLDRSTA